MLRDGSFSNRRCEIFQSGIFCRKRLLYRLENVQQPCVLLTERLAPLGIMTGQLDPPECPQSPRQYDTEGFKGVS